MSCLTYNITDRGYKLTCGSYNFSKFEGPYLYSITHYNILNYLVL